MPDHVKEQGGIDRAVVFGSSGIDQMGNLVNQQIAQPLALLHLDALAILPCTGCIATASILDNHRAYMGIAPTPPRRCYHIISQGLQFIQRMIDLLMREGRILRIIQPGFLGVVRVNGHRLAACRDQARQLRYVNEVLPYDPIPMRSVSRQLQHLHPLWLQDRQYSHPESPTQSLPQWAASARPSPTKLSGPQETL